MPLPGFSLSDGDNSSVPLAVSAGLIAKLGKRIKGLLEVNTGHLVGEVNGTSDLFLVNYGLRFAWPSIAVDFGLMKPFGEDLDDDTFPLGYPWLAFTYRAD